MDSEVKIILLIGGLTLSLLVLVIGGVLWEVSLKADCIAHCVSAKADPDACRRACK